jgi:hypothetical protein
MNKKSIWTNKDGLYVGFGPRGVETNSAAALTTDDGNVRKVVLRLNGPTLGAASAKELANAAVIPAGSNIKSVRVVVHSAFTGGTSVSIAGFTTADASDSATGFLNAVVTATLVAGYDATLTAPGAGAGGGYLGTILASNIKPVPTAAGTYGAGDATVTIEYDVPTN